MSQSKCKANLPIGSDQKYKDTNIITNLYAQILDINTKNNYFQTIRCKQKYLELTGSTKRK